MPKILSAAVMNSYHNIVRASLTSGGGWKQKTPKSLTSWLVGKLFISKLIN